MKYLANILEAVGNTSLVRINRVCPRKDVFILAKLEFMSPGGSVKDRMALYMIEKAEREGLIRPGGTIVESTSGNTGIGVAIASAIKGYRCIFTMPDKMSQEKVNMLKGLGAKVVITPTDVPPDSPESYYEVAKKIVRETPNSFYLNQYHSPDNIEAHYRTTGPEIWEATDGSVQYFLAGIGTGGTMSGAGRFLKEKNPSIKNIAIDPFGSVYYGYFKTGKIPRPHVYKVEGIGEDMLCGALDFSVIDDIIQVDDRESFLMARRLAREEGLFAGGSSGSAMAGACRVAEGAEPGSVIVVILPDSGNRYISKFYSDEWMRDNRFLIEKERLGSVRDVLAIKPTGLIVAFEGESCESVIERMKREGISQMPVLSVKKELKGMIHEIDLLNFLISGRGQPTSLIDGIISPLEGAVTPDTPISTLKNIFDSGNVAIVVEDGRPTGILTKIDLIEYLSKKMSA